MSSPQPHVAFVTIDMPREGGSGGQIASWRAVQGYATFASVDVLALTPPDVTLPPELDHVARRVATVRVETFFYKAARVRLLLKLVKSQLGGRSYRVAKFDDPRAHAILKEWTADTSYDLIHCDHLSAVPYAASVPNTPFIFLAHNVDSEVIASVAATQSNGVIRRVLEREARRTRTAELDAVRRAGRTLVLSPQDADMLVKPDPGLQQKVSVWPMPLPAVDVVVRQRQPSEPLSLLALGSLRSGGRMQGLRWFLREIWPGLREKCPDARLIVVGVGAPGDLIACDGRDGIEVRGFVADLDPVLREIDVCVIPLLAGGGIRVKIVELLARGIPCVGTSIGVRGFSQLEGVYEVEKPAEWIGLLADTARDPGPVRRAAVSGAEALRRERSPEAGARVLREAFEASRSQIR